MKAGDKIIVTPLQLYDQITAWCQIEGGQREFVETQALPLGWELRKMEVLITGIDYMEGDSKDIAMIYSTFQKFVDEELECECFV